MSDGEQAVTAALDALDLVEQVNPDRLTDQLRSLDGELQPYRHLPGAEEFTDRTLMYVGHIDKRLYFEIFEEILGHPIDALAETTGRTDPAIFRDTFLQHGITADETEALVPRYLDRLAERFTDARADIRRDGHLFDGTVNTLKAVHAQPGIVASVLTGNIQPVAVAKLEFFDLDPYVDTHIGAYGSDDPDKATLVTLAQQRAAASYGHTFDRTNTVLIGDSPHDIDAGRYGGATVIAVATGKHTAQQPLCSGISLEPTRIGNCRARGAQAPPGGVVVVSHALTLRVRLLPPPCQLGRLDRRSLTQRPAAGHS